LENLQERIDVLDNATSQDWNKIKNYGLTRFTGDERVTRFNTALTAVADEAATLFKGTAGTDEQIRQWRDNINSSQSPEQLYGNVKELIKLMGGRLQALDDQYRTGLGRPRDFQILSPNSQRVLKKMGIDPSTMDPLTAEKKQTPWENFK
jgi:hypothetical protein